MPKQSSIKKVHLQDLSEDRVALRYHLNRNGGNRSPQSVQAHKRKLFMAASVEVVTRVDQGPFGQICDGSRTWENMTPRDGCTAKCIRMLTVYSFATG